MTGESGAGRPEVWAGVEATVNRVGDAYFDQMQWSGHERRADDIDRLAGLGVTAVRYPVLWEKVAPDPDRPADWAWPDERLYRLRTLGVRPIAGLCHHGSGPPHTSLLDPGFADGLAQFAEAVAKRYPWVDAYTPVNEPLTTARFSGLYGHWYPHGRDDRSFVAALVNQCRAVSLSMQAVRRVNPAAALVQTEDFGQTHCTPRLQYQADFENDRRWVSWDLLCGRVDRRHPLRKYLLAAWATEADLGWFLDHPCPPDVFGVNYYPTSERFLDDRLDRYPAHIHGGNGRHRYADVEAVRVMAGGPTGPERLLRQVWERYGRPVAVTEAHLGGIREEQVRWLADVWRAACRARAAGADVRAVTVWAAFGSFDWNSLVTAPVGYYEPGPFDARCDPPRPTALAVVTKDLAAGLGLTHPVLDTPGWWQRSERLLFPHPAAVVRHSPRPARPVLITGATGSLGRAFARVAAVRGLSCVSLSRTVLDIADPETVADVLADSKPWAVVNAARYARVDAAEDDPDRCRRENAVGPAVLAAACAARGVRLVTFSSDLVFDGRAARPYRESDPVAPLSVYGRTKVEAEREVLGRHPDALVVRMGAVFGPWDDRNFVCRVLRSLRGGQLFAAATDLTVTPSYLPDLVNATLDLLVDGASGVWHAAGPDVVTWAEFAKTVAVGAGLNPSGVASKPAATLGWRAPRPAYSALGTARGCPLPPLADGLRRFLLEDRHEPAA